MTYALGVDLGTTYSAAAVVRDGTPRIVELGTRSASIPSVVFLRDDDAILAGEAAQRRAAGEPHRVAREFKRRFGDTTPILLGGAPYSADALTARLLRWIVDQVAAREGGLPDAIAITHPANWGPFKIDLLEQAVRRAGLDGAVLVTEPEAAVRHYASHERVPTGTVVAVYDLGGGTFDAALLSKTDAGFQPLGRPEGIERLGGIDFDAAVLGHVVRSLGGVVESLDEDDPGVLQALARLRQDCVDAKEGLSSDTDVSIPVLLPGVQTEVRLTRAELEAMIRPSLADSLDAMRRALASADVTPDDVDVVLLVGGSSRVPLVAQLVSNELGRPVAVDADPKHAIALGAALVAHEHVPVGAEHPPPAGPPPDAAGGSPVDEPAERPMPAPADDVTDPRETASVGSRDAPPSSERATGRSKLPIMVGAGVATLAALVTGLVIVLGSGGGSPDGADAAGALAGTTAPAPSVTTEATGTTTTLPASTSTTAPTTTSPTTTPSTTTTVATIVAPVPDPCPSGPQRTACITSISIDPDGGLVAPFETAGYTPELEPLAHHVHFYFDSVIDGDERNAGTEGAGGDWRLWDAPSVFTATGGDGGRPGYTVDDARAVGATRLCAIVATPTHAAVVGTGNCIDLPAEALDGSG